MAHHDNPPGGYIGMCGPKGYGFPAVLVINWVSILVILLPFWSQIGYRFLHASLQFFFLEEEATSSSRLPSPIPTLPSSTLFNACYAG